MKHTVLACVLLAASLANLSARVPGQQPEGFPAAGAPAVVTMISAGAAPRSALRYTPPAGARQHFEMTMAMSMAMEVGGASVPAVPLPVMKIGADCVVTEVAPSGDVTFTTAFTGAEIDTSANPALASQFESMKDALTSVKGSATISNRGVVRSSAFDFTKMANSQLAQVMGSTTDMLKNVSTPLPEEEVGVGARWEVRNTLATNGLTMFQKTDYELVAYDGKVVTLKTTVVQTALPQAMSNPALPPGAEVQLERYTGGGSGNMRLNPSELIPVSDGTIDSTMAMTVSMSGMVQQMVVSTSVKMTIAPGK